MEEKRETNNIIIGRNTVKEAIRSGRDIDAIVVAKTAQDGSIREILNLAKKRNLVIKEVPVKKLDEMAMPFGYNGRTGNHQGIAAQIPSIEYSEMEDIFAYAEERGEAPFIIALDGIQDPQNLGAIVRSAEALGAHGVITLKRRSAAMNAAACKTACGAEEYLPIVRVNNLVNTLEELKERGVWIAAADMDGVRADQADLKGALCLVIGAEGEGVSRLVMEHSDYIVKIDLKGKVSSLNASAAAAILIYEKKRQDILGK
ncbi:MAG: 23S rRNA (guanosine(2251)-2'-O)-methyltransferase RlmB [Christensenellaceae bacterium]|nr:23S rRNA (guanosine(2251)-2'-O)-methyltransferase RlmB [Christensenellaceae bacterium]